jgi:hypothetical protein
MKALCARVPRRGSTAICRTCKCGESRGQGKPSDETEYGCDRYVVAYAISIALQTVSSSSQSIFTVTSTFLYHSSLANFISSSTPSIPLSALFMTAAHISRTLSSHAFSFSSDTTSSYPNIVSRHRLATAVISPSDAASAPAGKLWCSLSAVIRRKDTCAGSGEQCIVQSLP